MATATLMQRFVDFEARIALVDRAADLMNRINSVCERISRLENVASGQAPAATFTATTTTPQPVADITNCRTPAGRPQLCHSITPDAGPIQQRLEQELLDKGFSNFRFVRVTADYYDRPLSDRRAQLDAASIHHLCKSIVAENTRAHPSVQGWSDPCNSKYYVVIVQYTARIHWEKIKSFVHSLNLGKVGKQYFNMRLAPGEVSDELSGYEHNAVSPIGLKTPLPIIMSHRIAELQPNFFWCGGGEIDLKVGMYADEFVKAYQPFVIDCTYDEAGGEGQDSVPFD